MLQTLVLQNFKRHRSLRVEFTQGLQLCTGQNFAGKSSLLHAILFALGGARAVPGGKSAITTKGESGTMVSLTFSADSHQYEVQRNNDDARLSEDGISIAHSASAVNRRIVELLGMDFGRFKDLRYAEQKQTEALLTLGAGELHRILVEISHADVVEKVIQRCSDLIATSKGGLCTLPPTDTEELERNLSHEQIKIRESQSRLGELSTQRHAISAEIDAIQEEYLRIQRIEQEIAHLEKRLGEISKDLEVEQGKHTALLKEIPNDMSLGLLEDEETDLRDSFNDVSNRLGIARVRATQVGALVGELQKLYQEIQSLQVEEKDLSGELSRMAPNIDIGSLQGRLSVLSHDLSVQREIINHSETALLSSFCPTCQRPYGDDPGHIPALNRKIKDAREKIESMEPSYSGLIQEIKEAERLYATKQKTERSLEAVRIRCKSKIDSYEEKMRTYNAMSDRDIVESIPAMEAARDDLSTRLHIAQKELRRFQGIHSQLELILERINKLSAERLNMVIPKREDAAPLIRKQQKLRQEKAELDAAYGSQEQMFRQAMTNEAVIRQRLETSRQVEEKRRHLEKEFALATELSKYLRSNRDRFMESLWEGILSYSSEFASDATGGMIERIVRTENGDFNYVENGVEMPIACASGAQRSTMGLGIQLALSKMLPCSLPVLLLDEVSSDMDPGVSFAVSSLLAAQQDQVILISHRELDGLVAVNNIHLEG